MALITRSMVREASTEAGQAETPTIGDLDCAIHPIFQRNKFPFDFPYELIEPALRLATKLIGTSPALGFWHTVLFSPVKAVGHVVDSSSQCESYEFTAARQELTAEQIGSYTLEAFEFAKVLVHELGHAAKIVAQPRDTQCFFPGGTVCEDGFELENRIFGGILCAMRREPTDGKSSTLSGGMKSGETTALLLPWPSANRTIVYVETESPIGIRLSENRPPLPDMYDDGELGESMGIVNYDFIDSLFTKLFWDETILAQGAQVLRPTIVRTERQHCSRDGAHRLVRMYRDAALLGEKRAFASFDLDELLELRKLFAAVEDICWTWDSTS